MSSKQTQPHATGPVGRRARGFSLVEVLTVVALIAVFLALAAPSLQDMIQRTRVKSAMTTFLADLKYARSEAIKTGRSVSVCATSNGTSCLASNTWHRGWIVFHDANASGTIDHAGDVVLRYRSGWGGSDTFVAAPELSAVTFGRMGLAANLADGPFNFVARASATDESSRQCVVLNQVGQQTVHAAGSASCS
jgi:type IV fimbrial biogenesis protein FimT